MKTLNLTLTLILSIVNIIAYGQDITFSDPHFKAALVANQQINTNGDAEIQKAEAIAFSGLLDISSSSIYNLSGIEYFSGMISLNCSNNYITSLNLSSNISLMRLNCSYNKLCSLEIEDCSELLSIDCSHNTISNLNLEFNTILNRLSCQNNELTTIDLSKTSDLQQLNCSYNNLNYLDVSQNNKIISINCANNQLTGLNIANSNNRNISTALFNATNNNLYCIIVGDVSHANLYWNTKIDLFSYFSNDCTALGFEETLEASEELTLYPNPVDDILTIDLGKTHKNVTVSIYDAIGKLVLARNYDEIQIANINLNINSGSYVVTVNTVEGMTASSRLTKK
jgi:hypothetical protein